MRKNNSRQQQSNPRRLSDLEGQKNVFAYLYAVSIGANLVVMELENISFIAAKYFSFFLSLSVNLDFFIFPWRMPDLGYT